MGLTYAKFKLTNAEDIGIASRNLMSEQDVRSMTTDILIDTGAFMMVINENVREQLGLRIINKKTVELADGRITDLPVAGPIKVEFENRDSICNAVVIPGNGELLMGDIEVASRNLMSEQDVRSMTTDILIDTGAFMMVINENVREQLGLRIINKKTVELADGRITDLPVAGPIKVEFENRDSICNAVVIPGNGELLMGAITLEEMDVIIDPKEQKLKVHPDRPYMAQLKLK
ncbi:hypothetical protein CHS0354_023706 [Potamilus streckersoni]|uniref:Clan AA aspartic protease n=1 Tax=Potamilus streckersoni TaxID=2493646 RepID=A0AAE0RYP5_9BIVA|nr:hypothetical protein CHS0354_023706 [Potamilus streckersoni]